MKKIEIIKDRAVPMPMEDIDTDQIIPARFLKAIDKKGFGDNLFYDWRYDKNDQPNPNFILNNPLYAGQILVAGKNFGCGSSREHAAWALYGYGFRVIISSFFADIFRGNALNNGILPIQVESDYLDLLLTTISENPETKIVVNLPDQFVQILPDGAKTHFAIDDYKKMCLLKGYDDIDYLLSLKDEIEKFEKKRVYIAPSLSEQKIDV